MNTQDVVIEKAALDILDFLGGAEPVNKNLLAKYWRMERWDFDAKMKRQAEQKALEFYSQTV
jgi:hypothetical protein